MSVLITGVAGFIGSQLATSLINEGETIFGIDNFKLGSKANIDGFLNHPNFKFENLDLTDSVSLFKTMDEWNGDSQITEVWHMAANSAISSGVEDIEIDLQATFVTTVRLLQVMQQQGIKVMCFASSSAIYGDMGSRSIREDSGPVLPASNYGAMKLASEAVISAAVESHLDAAYIFRFPNVVGTPATHGVILDFIRKLRANPHRLSVLGDGTQSKSYVHVSELINAMLYVRRNAPETRAVYNIGPAEPEKTASVRFIAESCVSLVSPSASIEFGVGNKGWVGDVPRFQFSTDKLKALGWSSQVNSESAVLQAIAEIARQELYLTTPL